VKKINIKIVENQGCGGCGECDLCNKSAPGPMQTNYKNAHNGQESRMHRTTLAHLMADTKVLLDLIQDGDNLPEWLEAKITKAGDYMSSAARYIAGNVARDHGQLEEQDSMSMLIKDQIMATIEKLEDDDPVLLQIINLLKTTDT
jgi:hypothetical protein